MSSLCCCRVVPTGISAINLALDEGDLRDGDCINNSIDEKNHNHPTNLLGIFIGSHAENRANVRCAIDVNELICATDDSQARTVRAIAIHLQIGENG